MPPGPLPLRLLRGLLPLARRSDAARDPADPAFPGCCTRGTMSCEIRTAVFHFFVTYGVPSEHVESREGTFDF